MEQIAMATSKTAITPFKSSNSGLVWRADRDQYIATRGFKTDDLLQFLTFPENCIRWVDLDVLVRVFDGRISETGRKAMRRRLTKAYHDFRDEKYLLLRSYNEAGQIVKVKLFDSSSESDRVHATQELEARQERQMDSREALEDAARIAQITLQWDSSEDSE